MIILYLKESVVRNDHDRIYSNWHKQILKEKIVKKFLSMSEMVEANSFSGICEIVVKINLVHLKKYKNW